MLELLFEYLAELGTGVDVLDTVELTLEAEEVLLEFP